MKRVKKSATFVATKLHVQKKHHQKLKMDNILISLTGIFVIGLILGALFIKNTNQAVVIQEIKSILSKSYSQSISHNFLYNFFISFLYSILCMSILYCLGLSLLGKPFVFLLLLCKGVFLGASTSYLYRYGALQGLTYFSAFYLFPLIFYCTHFIFACKEGLLTVKDLQEGFIKEQQKSVGKQYIKLYTIRFLLFSAGNILPAILFALENLIFKNKFIPDFLF